MLLVADMAQWLERLFLTGKLSLIYCWHVTALWVRCPLWVNQPGQFSLPSFSGGKLVVIHVISWITEVETGDN